MRSLPETCSRRQLVQAGALSALGLTLPGLLSAREQRPAGKEKSCIFIFQYGGLSQLDSWDMKPGAPDEVRGPYKPISTATPGFQVGELMPKLAGLSEKYCVLRSMTHTVPVHNVANEMLLAGTASPASDAAAFGSVVAKLRPSTASVPSYVWLQKFGGGSMPPEKAYLTGGFLGQAYCPLLIGQSHDDNPAEPNFRVKAFDNGAGITAERLTARRDLLRTLDQPAGNAGQTPVRAMSKFREQAFDLLDSQQSRRAFDVQQEKPEVRDRYGRHPLGQNLLLARRLVEAGVRLVSVVGWCGLAPGEKFTSIETWDMHGNAGIGIFENGWNGLGWALPKADEAVSALLSDLDERGLLESTLVVLVGEFGRTPTIKRGAKAIGRDHWPNCYSAMLAGAGIRGGAVYGASDKTAAYVKDHPVTLEDFTATLYHALDIDPATRLSPDGFTRPASTGQPIRAIF